MESNQTIVADKIMAALYIVRLHKTEVEKALQEINSKKATSWDRIQPKFIKLAATGISHNL